MKAFMSRAGFRGVTLIAALVAVGLLGYTAHAGKTPVAGKVTFLKGKAQRGPGPEGPWKRLKKNKKVNVGEYIKTEDDSRLELRFVDDSVVRVAANSLFHVADASVDVKRKDRKVSAALVAGKAWAKVSTVVGSENKFEVKTENAVAGVRGTTFRIESLEDKATLIKVYAGAVAVSNAPYFAKEKAAATADTGPIDFKNRKPVAAPFKEVSKKEWEQLCGEWMAVKVAADGTMAPAFKFAKAEDLEAEPDWIGWNIERDQALGTKYE